MKKILFLMFALVMSVSSAWAQHHFTASPEPQNGEFVDGTKFYYLAQHRSSKYYLSTASAYVDGSNLKLTNTTKPNDFYGQWAIVGDDTNGYKFYNRGEGTSKVLCATGNLTSSTGGDARFQMVDASSASNYLFKVKTGGTNGYSDAEYFYLATTTNSVWNKRGNYLAFWTNNGAFGQDDGSCTMVEFADEISSTVLESIALSQTSLNMNIGQIQSITVTPTPAEASAMVTWSSSAANVARYVDGKIQALSEGTATITATSTVNPAITASCEVTVTKQDWYTHVSPEMGINSQGGRVVSTISLNGTDITVPSYSYPYVDLTAQKFTVEAGASVQVGMTNIGWMHSMFYVDTDEDRQFTEGEMVTHSTLTGGSGTNAGIAAFTAPAAGTYRMRFKTDWHGNNANGNDPAGRIGDDGTLTGNNSIWANRGVIIDVMLEVTAPVDKTTVTYKVTNSKNEEVDVVVENVAIGAEASCPFTNGYFTDVTITEANRTVSETNNVFHVTGTWALPFEESKYYTMHSAKTDEYQDYVCNGTEAWCNGSVPVADNNNVWQLALVPGTLDLFTLKNFGYNKYAKLPQNGRQQCSFEDTPTEWTSGTGATSYFRVVKQEGGFNLQHPGDPTTNVGSHYDYKLGSWRNDASATNPSSINVVTEIDPFAHKANVTYEIYLNGNKIAEEVKEENIGAQTAYTLPASAADYVNIEFTPATIEGDMTATVNTTYKEGVIPFTPDGTTLYNLSLNRETPLVIYAEGEGISTKATDNESYVAPTYANQNNYKWSFGGDWLHGFTIKNEGTQKYVSYGSNNPENNIHATFVESTEGDGCHFELRLKDGMKYFRIQGSTNEAYISNYNGAGTTYLTNWNSSNNFNNSDIGAQFLIVPDAINPPAINWTLFGNKLDEVNAYPVGTGLGEYTCSEPLYIARWETTLSEQNEENYSDDLRDIEAAISGMSLNLPQPGHFYRLKGVATGKYLTCTNARYNNNDNVYEMAADKTTGDNVKNTILYYGTDNKLVMYGTGYGFANGMQASLDANTTFTFQADTQGAVGKYNVKGVYGTTTIYLWNYSTNLARNGSVTPECVWELEEVESLPVTFRKVGLGYATLYSPEALQIPSDVEAYVAKYDSEKGKLMTTSVEGVIPAETAVVLLYKGALSQDFTVDFSVAEENGAEQDNDLTGTYATINADANSYVFALQGGNAGFYKYKEGTTGTLAGFKAYYDSTTNPATRGFALDFGDVVTAISQLSTTTSQPTTAFDLAGRRVNAAQKGILIQNGNKVIR